jgi:D-glycero-D-manno-heptose 1,7-bisphosphate phosphatase
MRDQLRRAGVELDAVLHCPHLPDARVSAYRRTCECRKPAPGMLLRAATDLAIDLPRSVMVGDKLADLQAGHAAGVGRCILVLCGKPADAKARSEADAVHESLEDWVRSLSLPGDAPAPNVGER